MACFVVTATWIAETGAPAGAVLASPPVIVKSFGTGSLPLNATTTLRFTISNPNALVGLSGVGFTDAFPAGLAVATPNGLTGSCGGGTITAPAGGAGVALSNASLAAGTHCSFSIAVLATAPGTQHNSVTVTSSAGTGNTSTATLSVIASPQIGADFLPTATGNYWVRIGETVSIDFGLANTDTTSSLTNVGFTDPLPAGLVVATAGATGTCQGGTITAVPGSSKISLAGVTFTAGPSDPGSFCEFTVAVKATANGYWTNGTGPVTYTVAGKTGSGPGATGSLAVIGPGPQLYWSNGAGGASFARLDGSVGSSLNFACKGYGLAIDAAAGRVYLDGANCPSTSGVFYQTLGSPEVAALNIAGGVPPPFGGLAVDPALGRVYWDSGAFAGIGTAKLDGSGGGSLSTSGATTGFGRGLAVDASTRRVYWANDTTDSISYAALNGSGGSDLTITGTTPDGINGVAINAGTGRIYWTNGIGNTIGFANADGTNGGTLDTTGATVNQPAGIAIDPVAGRIYWANLGSDSIGFANLDGTGGGGTFSPPGGDINAPYYLSILYPPAAKKPPAISGGSAVGTTLTCSKGTWAKDVLGDFFYRVPRSYTYGWTRDGTTIVGATSKALVANTAGDYRCSVAASNQAGSKRQTSVKHTVA